MAHKLPKGARDPKTMRGATARVNAMEKGKEEKNRTGRLGREPLHNPPAAPAKSPAAFEAERQMIPP